MRQQPKNPPKFPFWPANSKGLEGTPSKTGRKQPKRGRVLAGACGPPGSGYLFPAAVSSAVRNQAALFCPDMAIAARTMRASSGGSRTANTATAGPFVESRGRPIFLFVWRCILVLFTKVLDRIRRFVYKSPVSKRDADLPGKCPHALVRLADQRHPAATGAGNED